MRGFIIQEINERESPSVEAEVLGYYAVGSVVDIEDVVPGDVYDGEDLWYKLKTGTYLWAGGVNVQRDVSVLPEEDRKHFLISYRQADTNDIPDLGEKEPPNTLY